jgi:hypothetical protein
MHNISKNYINQPSIHGATAVLVKTITFFEIFSLCNYIKKAGIPSPADIQCDSNAPTPEVI